MIKTDEMMLEGFFVAYMRHQREADAANFKRFIQKWHRWSRSYEGNHDPIDINFKRCHEWVNATGTPRYY